MEFSGFGRYPLCTSWCCHGFILCLWGIYQKVQHMVTAQRKSALTPFSFFNSSHTTEQTFSLQGSRGLLIKQLHSLKQEGHCPWQLSGPPAHWAMPWGYAMHEASAYIRLPTCRDSARWEMTCQIYMKYVWKIDDEQICCKILATVVLSLFSVQVINT